MPTRPYSAAIVGGRWPTTPADAWSDVAQGLRQKANEDTDSARSIKQSADGLGAEASGETIDAMCGKCLRIAQTVQNQADLYYTMSEVVDEVAQLIYHARAELDEIDRAANEEIERLKKLAATHKGSAGVVAQAIAAVLAQARARPRRSARMWRPRSPGKRHGSAPSPQHRQPVATAGGDVRLMISSPSASTVADDQGVTACH